MNGNRSTILPPDDLGALIQAAQAVTKAISEAGLSVPPDMDRLSILVVAGDNLARSVKVVQAALFHSIARPVPTAAFDTFVDSYGEINGG